MLIQWPQLLPPWVTAELALHDWQARIARVEVQETAHFAGLPYVRGVAVIGSVGRGTQWPLSDLDLFAMADPWEGEDPEHLLLREETERNRLLRAADVPNDVEIAGWVLTTGDVRAALDADDEAFLRCLDHPHWLGLVLKAEGARVSHDSCGLVAPFFDRCQRARWDDRFLRLWLAHDTAAQRARLEEAAALLMHEDWAGASLAILRVDGASGCYARWRTLPESISRGVSRFLTAAEAAGKRELGVLYLIANRLREEEVWARFAATPPEGKRERDAWSAVRRAGEQITELEVTRDFLHVSSWMAMKRDHPGPWPAWTGVTADESAVRAQYEAAAELLRRLEVR
jgi:predicted nucleotidyltransferase